MKNTRARTRQVTYTVTTGEKYTRFTEAITDEKLEEVVEYMKDLKKLKALVLDQQDGGGYVIIHPDHLVSIQFS